MVTIDPGTIRGTIQGVIQGRIQAMIQGAIRGTILHVMVVRGRSWDRASDIGRKCGDPGDDPRDGTRPIRTARTHGAGRCHDCSSNMMSVGKGKGLSSSRRCESPVPPWQTIQMHCPHCEKKLFIQCSFDLQRTRVFIPGE